jgi:hypothetical protein
LDGFLFDEFFAVIAAVGLATEHIYERSELKGCDILFVNTTAPSI